MHYFSLQYSSTSLQQHYKDYQHGGMKAPDIEALDCALKVKQHINSHEPFMLTYAGPDITDFIKIKDLDLDKKIEGLACMNK